MAWLPGTCGSETQEGRKHGKRVGRGPRWEPPGPSSGGPSSVSNTGQACMGELDSTRAAACGPEGRNTHRRPTAGRVRWRRTVSPPRQTPPLSLPVILRGLAWNNLGSQKVSKSAEDGTQVQRARKEGASLKALSQRPNLGAVSWRRGRALVGTWRHVHAVCEAAALSPACASPDLVVVLWLQKTPVWESRENGTMETSVLFLQVFVILKLSFQ